MSSIGSEVTTQPSQVLWRRTRHGFVLGAVLGLSILLLMALAIGASAARDDLVLVSRATGANGSAAEVNNHPIDESSSVSADGRYVVFTSASDNLSDEDDDLVADVFVRDLVANTTTLVSRASGGAAADGDSHSPSISADGRSVAFVSEADNLSAEDEGFFDDVFVRDLLTETTTLVSRASGISGAAADDNSGSPSISADGRYVAFGSIADNLPDDEGDCHDSPDVFVRDLGAHTTTHVSMGSPGDEDCFFDFSGSPSISANGRFVAFASHIDSLSSEDDNRFRNIFVRDLVNDTTTFASRASGAGGVSANGESGSPSISADGHYLAFTSAADNLSAADDNAFENVFVRDLQANATTLVSRATGSAGAGADDQSGDVTVGRPGSVLLRFGRTPISADGRFVAFTSDADNLSAADNNAFANVFVRDLQANATTLISRAAGPESAAATDESVEPAISGNARLVTFASVADNLSGADNDDTWDIFARDFLGPLSYNVGDVFIGGGRAGLGGVVGRFDPSGFLRQTLETTERKAIPVTGMCFDADGNLYTANFLAGNTTVFDDQGNLFVHPWTSDFTGRPKSCLVDPFGNVYVGEVDGENLLRKFNRSGTLLDIYSPATENRGIDRIDLAPDGCTLLYTSDGTEIKRFDVCDDEQLPDLGTVPLVDDPGEGIHHHCGDLRVRARGGVLVACFTAVFDARVSGTVFELRADGSVKRTIPFDDAVSHLALDPDGQHAWAAGSDSLNVYRFSIESSAGGEEPAFNTADRDFSSVIIGGLAVYGEPTINSIAVQIALAAREVSGLNLAAGIRNSFTTKLESALAAVRRSSFTAAQGQLGAFLNHTRAQAGKKLTQAQASSLITRVTPIRQALAPEL